jgi:hypothetical protein
VVSLLAGFGRAAAEVGAIIIVGGNIDGFTRTMTAAIALETSKGNLPLAMGLGADGHCHHYERPCLAGPPRRGKARRMNMRSIFRSASRVLR